MRLRAALVLASASLLSHGCVAAAIPLVAGGAIVRSDHQTKPPKRDAKARAAKAAEPVRLAVATEAAETASAGVIPTNLTALPPPGAGEDAAMVLQAYQGLWAYLSTQVAKRKRGEPLRSVVLEEGATLDAPRYVPCGAKPLAVIFDLDENPAKSADPDGPWRRWHGDERDAIIAVPGAVEGVEAAQREGIAAIFTSARSPDSATGVVAALERLGFGAVEPGRTLYLRGGASAEGARRTIAASHCVIALVGDSLDDFSSLLPKLGEARIQSMAVTDTMVAPLWGAGWFLLANPVRSTATASSNPLGGK